MYTLTPDQENNIKHFVINGLSNYIDEELCAEWLVTDEMLKADDFIAINERKMAAIEYIKSIL